MARPATKQLGLTGILREVLAAPLRNPEITAAVFLLLLPCNFLITFPQVSPRLDIGPPLNRLLRRLQERSAGKALGAAGHGGPPPAEVPAFQELPVSIVPLGYVVGELTTMAMVYLAAVACAGKHATIQALLSKVGRSWNQLAISYLYLYGLSLAFAGLCLVLVAVPVLFAPPSWVFILVFLAFFFPTACFLVVFSVVEKISKDRRPEPSRVGPEGLVAPRSRQRSEFNLQRTTETPRWSDTPTIKLESR